VADIEELFADQKRVAARSRLGAAASAALAVIYESDGDNAQDLLGKATAALRNVSDIDAKLAAAGKLLSEAAILTQEASSELRRYLDDLDIDPKRQDEIERRAAALEALGRKHRVGVLELPAHLARLEHELSALENVEVSLKALEAQMAEASRDYRSAAQLLTQGREAAARQLEAQVTELMQTLGMAGGTFAVAVTRSDNEFTAHGADDVEFLVSANPGQPPKSLGRVASGGELSRISLALQVAGRAGTSSQCMVFDEVDAGIGGAVAEIVGKQLRELGERAQVLCVTHLAQVASQAHSQFRVLKLSDGKIARTAVTNLDAEARVDEIARMLGGIDITDQARAHARDMLARAAPMELKKKKQARLAPR